MNASSRIRIIFILILFTNYLSSTLNTVLCADSLIVQNPLVVVSDPLICNFKITFNHLDSSSVSNCSFMGTVQFCDKNDKFFISINHCGESLSDSPFEAIIMMQDCEVYYLGGDLIDTAGYKYDGIIYCRHHQLESVNKRVTYFKYFNYDDKSLWVRYKLLDMPNNWTFEKLYNYCKFLSNSIEIKVIDHLNYY